MFCVAEGITFYFTENIPQICTLWHALTCVFLCVDEGEKSKISETHYHAFQCFKKPLKLLTSDQIPMLSAASPLPFHSHSLFQEGEFRGACGETESSL